MKNTVEMLADKFFSVCQSETSYEHTACPVQQYTLCGTDPNALLLLQNSNMHSVSIRDNITLPSAERCSENNFRIISRTSKESSVAGRKTKREKHEVKINIVQSQNIKQELGKNKTKKKNNKLCFLSGAIEKKEAG